MKLSRTYSKSSLAPTAQMIDRASSNKVTCFNSLSCDSTNFNSGAEELGQWPKAEDLALIPNTYTRLTATPSG